MAQVAVLHNTLDFHGGADAICLAVCEAIQPEHDVSLFTLSETSPEALSEQFDSQLGDVDVRMPPAGRPIARLLSGVAPWMGSQLALRSVLLHRFFLPRATNFDLAVSTANEFELPIPSVQYVHFPQFYRHRRSETDPGRSNRLWSRLAGPDRTDLESADCTVLANSSWTAEAIETIYGTSPDVVHPPVDPIPCNRRWNEREDGILVVGRLAPDKRILEAIEIVDRIRTRGHDVHLHVVGTASKAYRHYTNRIARKANARPYVTIERNVSRDRLEHLLCSHKYGLNCKEREPFGMAVAEYVASGMIGFAPVNGGQRDVLAGREDRLFDTIDDAVDVVVRAIVDDDTPSLPRGRFASDRFRASFRQYVARSIDSSDH
ncbi:MAG: glycosyltransferase family 4 protein [Halodesulfurarchaeum sp.]